jgi:Cu2+-exporting ATPase
MTVTNDEEATVVLDTRGIRFATEKNVIESVLGARPGVISVHANPVGQTATVTYDTGQTGIAELRTWVEECGFHCIGRSVPEHICVPIPTEPAPDADTADARGVHDQGADMSAGSMASMVTDMRNRFIVAVVFALAITMYSHLGRDILGLDLPVPFGLRSDVFELLLSLPVIFWSASMFFSGALAAVRARTLDMMVLVAVGIGTGWAYSVGVTLTGGGQVFYEASTMLAAFVLLGHWFELRARGGANDAIRTLLELAPSVALVERDALTVEVPTADVSVDDVMVVRPGSKVPTDGVVIAGESEVDESMVTGESLPVHKQPGAPVIGATINRNGMIRVRATKVGSDTALAQIVQLVQEAQNSTAPGQQLADRAAFWLVLVALIGGAVTFAAWALFSNEPLTTALLYAITVVVITCPDALGLATPTAIMVGSGLGARRGVLFKSAASIEASARIDVVVMDKTGTLTKGEPEVTDALWVDGSDPDVVLRLTAAVEASSEHPIAQAVITWAASRLDSQEWPPATGFRNVPGQGVVATVEGHSVAIGNQALMVTEGIAFAPLQARASELAVSGRTIVCVAADGAAAAVIGVADAPRPTSEAAVAELRELGVRVVMLTGDNQATADHIASQLGISEVIADVRPADKSAKVAELQADGAKVAMVGDGINDAPALAQADLGVAIGAGTDVAIETADLVLMRSDPLDVPTAISIGRGTLRKMRQNLGWAVSYNTIALPIAAGVFVPAFGFGLRPEIAALAMSGSSVIVAVNALMLKRLRLPGQSDPDVVVTAPDTTLPREHTHD